MLTLVLGSAAGGGFPQWNCNTDLCRSARYGEPSEIERMQRYVEACRKRFDDESRVWPAVARVLMNLDEFVTRE